MIKPTVALNLARVGLNLHSCLLCLLAQMLLLRSSVSLSNFFYIIICSMHAVSYLLCLYHV